jgi:Predicted nucleotidyltransferases
MNRNVIKIPKDEIAAFCRRHHIRKLSLFGSVLRDDFGPDSDVDVLVEFEEGHTPGLALIRIQDELSRILGGREVDLVIEEALYRRLKKRILSEAQVEYVQGCNT